MTARAAATEMTLTAEAIVTRMLPPAVTVAPSPMYARTWSSTICTSTAAPMAAVPRKAMAPVTERRSSTRLASMMTSPSTSTRGVGADEGLGGRAVLGDGGRAGDVDRRRPAVPVGLLRRGDAEAGGDGDRPVVGEGDDAQRGGVDLVGRHVGPRHPPVGAVGRAVERPPAELVPREGTGQRDAADGGVEDRRPRPPRRRRPSSSPTRRWRRPRSPCPGCRCRPRWCP